MSVLRTLIHPSSSCRHRLMALGNIIASGYFIMMVLVNYFLSAYVVLPNVYSKNPNLVLFHNRIIKFLALNVIGNYFLGWCVSSSINRLKREETTNDIKEKRSGTNQKSNGKNKGKGDGIKDKSVQVKNSCDGMKDRRVGNGMKKNATQSRFCKRCDRTIPSRVHHCPLCNTCILKRDHHCFFMCTCIGYYNQKYFIMYCFYQFIAGLYAGVLCLIYMKFKYGVVFTGPWTFLTLLPHSLYLWWMLESVGTFQLFFVAIFYASMMAGFSAGGFFFWQVALIYFGQSTYEQRAGIEDYSGTVWENFRDVFGKWWFVTLILPLPLPQLGDGVYRKKSTVKYGKQK